MQRAAQEQAAKKAAEREARRPVCAGCGAKFTDERWKATERVGWGVTQEPRPSLCGDCDRRYVTDAREAWPDEPRIKSRTRPCPCRSPAAGSHAAPDPGKPTLSAAATGHFVDTDLPPFSRWDTGATISAARSERMTAKKDPAKLVRQARDLIEEFNRVVLDDAKDLSAPALSEATQALKSLVDRLPQAFEQTADVLELLAAGDRVTVEQGDPKTEVATTAAELRAVAADSEQLAKSLSHPASALFMMGGR
ncbi:hypothetical protein NKH18_01000 [Streptomyces sp. M10(2022)]